MVSEIHVFYFRGLSTYGRDEIVWSFLNFGSFSRPLALALKERGVTLHPVLGMGSGTFAEILPRAREFLLRHPVWSDPLIPCHLLGQSAGGIIARMIEAEFPSRAQTLTTIATPHRGTSLAQLCLNLADSPSLSSRLLQALRYDLRTRRRLIAEFTPQAVARQLSGLHAGFAKPASIVCFSDRRKWCAPLRLLHLLPGLSEFDGESDGLVERRSQEFGEILGEFDLDHFRQIGHFGDRPKFLQICALLANYYHRACESQAVMLK